MLQEGEFATEMDIQAVASFLQIPVYLYTRFYMSTPSGVKSSHIMNALYIHYYQLV